VLGAPKNVKIFVKIGGGNLGKWGPNRAPKWSSTPNFSIETSQCFRKPKKSARRVRIHDREAKESPGTPKRHPIHVQVGPPGSHFGVHGLQILGIYTTWISLFKHVHKKLTWFSWCTGQRLATQIQNRIEFEHSLSAKMCNARWRSVRAALLDI